MQEQVKFNAEVYEGLQNQIEEKYVENIIFSLTKPEGKNTLTLDLDEDINNLYEICVKAVHKANGGSFV